ncbi:structural protein [Rosellinia necatrix quadrivirus 1]|uniref:Structural protein n=1 Tax=Rosellinia necatrix quadrivirus 1 TaxID=1000373 RepID=H1ACC8_RNQV1|nr:structural protein [Rosellinia necatrix quadrivirus 1]BAL46426.1 structural protein [Rosellinia necatrix quadrivirus 1]
MSMPSDQSQETRAPTSVGNVIAADVQTAVNDKPTADIKGTDGTGIDEKTGLPIDKRGEIPMVEIERTAESVAKMMDLLRSEKFTSAAADAKLMLQQEFQNMVACAKNAPQMTVNAGRLYLGCNSTTAIIAGDSADGYDIEYSGKRIEGQCVVALEPLTLSLSGSTSSVQDDSDAAKLFALAVSQVWGGASTVGIVAPMLQTVTQEQTFRRRVERDSGFQHHAALNVVVTSIIGWLIHFGDSAQKKTIAGWLDEPTDFALKGMMTAHIASGMDWAGTQIYTASAMQTTTDRIRCDYAGRLLVRSTARKQMLRSAGATDTTETENSGRYLLALPRCDASVAAAALALTWGKPKLGGAGHSSLMAAMSEAGVGYITNVNGTRATPAVTTTFGREDMVYLLGFALRHMADAKDQVVRNVLAQVSGLFRPAACSAHEWMNVHGALMAKVSRPMNEPAFREVWNVANTTSDLQMIDRDRLNGEHFLRQFAQQVTVNATGTAMAIYQAVLAGPTGITDGDTIRLQDDLYHHLFQYASTAYADGVQVIQANTRMANKMAPPVNALAAWGLGSSMDAFTGPHCAYYFSLANAADGCFYVKADGRALAVYTVDVNHTSSDTYLAMAQLEPGTVATAKGAGSTITTNAEAAGVVDGSFVTEHHSQEFTTIMAGFTGLQAEVYNWLLWHAAKMEDSTHSHIMGRESVRDVVAWLSGNGAEAHKFRSSIGLGATAAAGAGTRRAWRLHMYDGAIFDHRITDTERHPYMRRLYTPAEMRAAGNDLFVVDRVWKIVMAMRAQLMLISVQENGGRNPHSRHYFGEAAAIGVVGHGFTNLFAYCASTVHSGKEARLITQCTDTPMYKKEAKDLVPPMMKVAQLSTLLAHGGAWCNAVNMGGNSTSIGLSILGDGTMPLQTVPWTINEITYLSEEGTKHGIEAIIDTNGSVSVKVKMTMLEPRQRFCLYDDNKTSSYITANESKTATYVTLKMSGSKNVNTIAGLVAHDYKLATTILASTYDKGRKTGLTLEDLQKVGGVTGGGTTGGSGRGSGSGAGRGGRGRGGSSTGGAATIGDSD